MDPQDIGITAAKARWSELLDNVQRGRVCRITKRGTPIAELRPVTTGVGRPSFGADRGRVVMSDHFEAPVPGLKPYR